MVSLGIAFDPEKDQEYRPFLVVIAFDADILPCGDQPV